MEADRRHYPRNQLMWVHSEQIKQVALRSVQSTLKKLDTAELSWARLDQKSLL